MLKMDGFDNAAVGIIRQWDGTHVIAYSEDLIIEELSKSMSIEEAWDYYHFNIADTYMGPGTPVIIETMNMESIEHFADELET